jgi:hypothetical protein
MHWWLLKLPTKTRSDFFLLAATYTFLHATATDVDRIFIFRMLHQEVKFRVLVYACLEPGGSDFQPMTAMPWVPLDQDMNSPQS